MITLSNVNKHYGQSNVLKNVTLSIETPGIYCLLGRNGAGKTTLLKSIAGYQNICSGTITVNGKCITSSTLETGVSYIENFAKHFNLPVRKLIQIAGDLNPSYDLDFAYDMMERFELNGHQKFNHLSLGMKTMVSSILCLANTQNVILLDEPVLGFDAMMRLEFYDLLLKSYEKYPRVIIISTHLIDEIAKSIQNLVIIDKGSICFFDTLQAVEANAYSISGLKKEVDAASKDLNVIGQSTMGNLVTTYIFDTPPPLQEGLDLQKLSLQEFFIQLVGNKGGCLR